MESQQFGSAAGLDALFDLSFTRFITISMIKVIYLLAMLGIALGWLGLVIAGFTQGVLPGLGAIVFATVAAALYLLMVRVSLELVVVIFRIGENTSRMAGNAAPTGGFPVEPMPAVPMSQAM